MQRLTFKCQVALHGKLPKHLVEKEEIPLKYYSKIEQDRVKLVKEQRDAILQKWLIECLHRFRECHSLTQKKNIEISIRGRR